MLDVQRRLAIVGATTALLSSTLIAATGTVAVAVPTECEPNSSWYKTTGDYSYRLTHWKGYQLPPGGSLTLTKSATYQEQLTAGIKISAGGSVSASGIIAKAEAHFNVELAANKSKTTTDSVSVSATVVASDRDRYYVAWAGNRYYNGSWYRYQCNGDGTDSSQTGYGTWRSFRSYAEGMALCPAKRYAEGSWMYKACKKVWN